MRWLSVKGSLMGSEAWESTHPHNTQSVLDSLSMAPVRYFAIIASTLYSFFGLNGYIKYICKTTRELVCLLMVSLPKSATSVPRPALPQLLHNSKRQTGPGKRVCKRVCKCVHTHAMIFAFASDQIQDKKRAIAVIMCCPPLSSFYSEAVSLVETPTTLNWSWHVILLRLQLRWCAHGCFVPTAFTFWKINVQIYF